MAGPVGGSQLYNITNAEYRTKAFTDASEKHRDHGASEPECCQCAISEEAEEFNDATWKLILLI